MHIPHRSRILDTAPIHHAIYPRTHLHLPIQDIHMLKASPRGMAALQAVVIWNGASSLRVFVSGRAQP